eukprot:scpid102555/ scgid1421/ 
MSSPISNRKKLGKLVTEHSTLARRPHAEQPSHGRQEPETVGATSLSVMPRMWTYPTHHAGQQHTTHTTSTSDSDPGDRDDRRVELPAIVDRLVDGEGGTRHSECVVRSGLEWHDRCELSSQSFSV